MNLNKDVFRKYDIRGIADTDFSGDFPYYLGAAFASYVIKNGKSKTISVSGDVRLSTTRLKRKFIRGLADYGINVIDIGLLPTPVNSLIVGILGVARSHSSSDSSLLAPG